MNALKIHQAAEHQLPGERQTAHVSDSFTKNNVMHITDRTSRNHTGQCHGFELWSAALTRSLEVTWICSVRGRLLPFPTDHSCTVQE